MKSVAETIEASKPSNWEPVKSDTQADKEIEAYYKGQKDGIDNYKKLLKGQVEEHKKYASSLTFNIFEHLKQNDINPEFAYLRANSWDDLNIIIGIPEKKFNQEGFLPVYDFVWEQEQKAIETTMCKISFSFLGLNENFDLHCLISDGYYFKFTE
ncbi:hypothetical protein [Leptospira sp. id769339]|uniref:hypothetical protein n=1 Tax=Leptospira sp. id769339 TaxID=2864221 RepID=UPI00214D0B74|nr:hypothetical protein [Leptospira sp. id769339]MCR1795355.1 hypothetical protein [Leptospira sp. id769339]